MVDILELAVFEEPLQLAEFPNITPDIVIPLAAVEIAGQDAVASRSKFLNEARADETAAACNQNPIRIHGASSKMSTLALILHAAYPKEATFAPSSASWY
jgi:hypothetical protein